MKNNKQRAGLRGRPTDLSHVRAQPNTEERLGRKKEREDGKRGGDRQRREDASGEGGELAGDSNQARQPECLSMSGGLVRP